MLNFIIKCANCNTELNPALISDDDFIKIEVADDKAKITCTCGNEIEISPKTSKENNTL